MAEHGEVAVVTGKPPGYDEPLDSPFIDPDPDFREVLRLLNVAGVHTVSSCQGHAPGTRYPDVQEWMRPYVTCSIEPGKLNLTLGLLEELGGSVRISGGNAVASFSNGWDWRKSVNSLRAKLPHIRCILHRDEE